MGTPKSSTNGPDWPQIYAIYGLHDWHTPLFLFLHALFFSFLSILLLLYFHPLSLLLPCPPSAARFTTGFLGSVTALSSLCLFFAAANFLYSSLPLQWEMAHNIVSNIPDWSSVRHALDLGSGRGILLNAVALQLKKSGSSGRVVGLGPTRTLRTAALEGVQEYVTCRAGDPRALPFSDGYFDVVVSAMYVSTVGKEHGSGTAAAAAERMRVLGEAVRVLKAGGVGVVWDVVHAPEYAQRLIELKMEDVRVSERVTAFMVSSHVVSFRKPRRQIVGPGEVSLDWRFNHLC